MVSKPTDEDIVNAIRSGNEARINWAIRLLYESKGYVTNFVWTDAQRDLLQFDHHFVNDLFQDTIVTFLDNVWKHRYEVRSDTNLLTYIRSISYKKYRNKRRKILRDIERNQDYLLTEVDELDDDEKIQLETELESMREDALSQLDEDERLLIQLSDFENKSHREIGELLGISTNAAKQRYYRARIKLNTILK